MIKFTITDYDALGLTVENAQAEVLTLTLSAIPASPPATVQISGDADNGAEMRVDGVYVEETDAYDPGDLAALFQSS